MSERNAVRTGLMAICFVGSAFVAPPALADDGLTPYEQSIVCKLAGTCEANEPTTAVPQAPESKTVGAEADFTLYRGQTPPQTTTAPRVASPQQPNFYRVQNTSSARSATTSAPRYATGPRRQTPTPAPRPNAADMRLSFGNGSADLDKRGRDELVSFLHALQSPALATAKFVVEGHTSSVGSREYNLDLSQRRAQTVVDFLVRQGIEPSRLVARGFGFDKPRVSGDPRNGRNRRVEIVKDN